ncbi:MAG: PqqD family protein [Candidatus Binataceae bacterium]
MSEKYISPGRNTPSRMLGGEMIVMSVSDSTLFNLNPTASALWQAADGTTPLSEIVKRQIVANFSVEFDEAYRDALTFAEELARHGILRITDEPVRREQP